MAVRSFSAVLQPNTSLSDIKWEFHVPDLPSAKLLDSANLIKSISFLSTKLKHQVLLKVQSTPTNRITRNEPLHCLLLLSFEDFRLRLPPLSDSQEVQLATGRESAEYIASLLKTGVVLNGTHYHFFGHSNSQTKSRSCYMYACSKAELQKKVESLGDFSKIQTVGKKAKRIGLLFSSAEIAVELGPERCEDIHDVSRNDYTFTDGCGLIGDSLARLVAQRRGIIFRNKKYLPSVFQIRYRGYKGVLTRSTALQGKVQVQFRDSMRKFKDVKDLSFSVVDYSKPYAFGYLNDEIVLLLHALGISTEVLLRRQADHFQFLHNAANTDGRAAFQYLSYHNEMKLAEKVLMEGVESVRGPLRKLLKDEMSRLVNKRDEQRCRIMIQQSRLLFGVCDPTGTTSREGKLKPGTCFVRITDHENGEPRTLINTQVLVTRNPCLHPGDLQKLRVVDVPEWTHLKDCIVFSTSGNRPSADMMSGGDLDGDKFFVTWDPDIVPRNISAPAAYPGVKERIEFQEITGDRRAEFFAHYTNASLGRVKNLYLKWARLKGPLSAECQQLNRLFSQCVDGNRIKVPQNLEDPPEPDPDAPPFVFDVLHQHAMSWIATMTTTVDIIPEDILDFISSREDFALTEFELLQLVFAKCSRENLDFGAYTQHFNYAALTDEQKMWVLNVLPPTKDLPSLVWNGLLQSELVNPGELRRFGLNHSRLHWQSVFTSHSDRMGRFLSTAARTLETFHKKLIVIQASERLLLMVYIPQKIVKATETAVDTSVRVFALPRSAGSDSSNYRVQPTKISSKLYCDDGAFQLYEGKRGNTFIFLTRGPKDTSSLCDLSNKHDQRKKEQELIDNGTNYDCRASVALQKISSSVQRHVGRMNRAGILGAEIYVISNRDIESMRFLDSWLDSIDTDEVLPLFETMTQEYRVPTLDTLDHEGVPALVRNVVWQKKLAALGTMTETKDIGMCLQLLNVAGQRSMLRNTFAELLRLAHEGPALIATTDLVRVLLGFLMEAAFLAQMFLESPAWSDCKLALSNEASQIFLPLLRRIVLSANELQAFVRKPFLLLIQELQQMSKLQLAELIELIALAVGEPEFAIDLLLECIQPEASRLLAGSSKENEQLVKHLVGIALNHIDEANSNRRLSPQGLQLQHDGFKDGFEAVKTTFRIDMSEGTPRTGDHIRFVAVGTPQNAPLEKPYAMDAIVITSNVGSASFRCLHRPPPYLADCAWRFVNCGSFVTSKAMIDAVVTFYSVGVDCCELYHQLVGRATEPVSDGTQQQRITEEGLNDSQNQALTVAIQNPLALLWGPPGTGKTHTILVILKRMLQIFENHRFLITAPTHNAVDNILKRYIAEGGTAIVKPLRVSTSLGKVAPELRAYTCDAMLGKDLSEGFAGVRQARKRVKESRLVFTTCVGSALGLLRHEAFDTVLVDEASQQTEPETLIPLTKGCKRAVLVGDHVQLRATVQKHAVITGFDISLFERHYELPTVPGVSKIMLDTQYRMHPDICSFSLKEFYDNKLHSAEIVNHGAIPASQFPWPKKGRKSFIQCSTPEDLGHQSKSNRGQVQLCQRICELLATQPATIVPTPGGGASKTVPAKIPSIVILTPYTRQRDELKSALPGLEVSSIDGFQGREADIVIFVTVRCNAHLDVGFLKDMRRLNVAMTRAKAGVIVIGDKTTLTAQASEDADTASKTIWKRLLDSCTTVQLPSG